MVDYSPLGDCIFDVVFVIDLGNGSVPDACLPLFFATFNSISFVSRGIRSGPIARRKRVKSCAGGGGWYRKIGVTRGERECPRKNNDDISEVRLGPHERLRKS